MDEYDIHIVDNLLISLQETRQAISLLVLTYDDISLFKNFNEFSEFRTNIDAIGHHVSDARKVLFDVKERLDND